MYSKISILGGGILEKEIIKFNLSGMSACIRKPDSNTTYFTYNNPHKMTIMGILGAIIGENGYNYNAFKNIDELPECYINLKHLKIAVEPLAVYGNFSKKIQTFNNSVGYASKEVGGNLVVEEQWLENPSWNIYILSDDTKVYEKIKDYLVNSKCEYIPYLGKNDHFATISDVEILQGKLTTEKNIKISSLVDKNCVDVIERDVEDLLFEYNPTGANDEEFEYIEVIPTELDKKIGYINYKPFAFTNKELVVKESKEIYSIDGKNIFFY